jgi:acetyl esterase/lipase
MLETMAALGLPPLESMSPVDARMFMEAVGSQSPPGPEVGRVVDGRLPGAAGELDFRAYHPHSDGLHPTLVYFHGGGWVIGSHTSDDAFCRDLCNRLEAVVVSVGYRHGPEDPFPAAADDAVAAVRWVGEHLDRFGSSGELFVGGWSAGANVATVACHQIRDHGGPAVDLQVLVCPVTDSDMSRPSYVQNGDGFGLTSAIMRWFWEHATRPEDRHDPRIAPLRAERLDALPPAVIVTAEFDPLRDEGVAYADALRAAGVPVRLIPAAGHVHTSIVAVGALPTGADVRSDIEAAVGELRRVVA